MDHENKNEYDKPRIVGLNTMERHILAEAVASDEMDTTHVDRFGAKARKLMKAYDILCDEIPSGKGEIRMLSDDELSIWSGAVGASVKDALALCPYIAIIKPCYSTEAGTSIIIDDGYRAMVGPWFFDEACRQFRVTMLIHAVLHPLMGHCDKKLAYKIALMAGDCQINQGLVKNLSLHWPVDGDMLTPRGNAAYGSFGRKVALFPSDVRTASYPNGLPDYRDFSFYYNEIFNEFPPMIFNVDVDEEGNIRNVTVRQAEQKDTSKSELDDELDRLTNSNDSSDSNEDTDTSVSKAGNDSDNAGASDDENGDDSSLPDVSDKGGNFNYIEDLTCKGVPSSLQRAMLDGIGLKPAGIAEKTMAQTLSQQIAKSLAKKAGTSSGSSWINFVIDAVTPPITPWSTIIAGFIAHNMDQLTTIGRDVKSPRRVDRREFIDDPSMIRRGFTDPRITIVWIMDVSGSMMGDDLPRGMNELAGLLTSSGNIDVKFLPIDTEVKGFQSIDSISSIKATQGAGGTALSPAFPWIGEHVRPLPDALVLTTDCELADWPSVVKEMKYGVLKGTPLTIIATDDNSVLKIPQELLSIPGVDAFCVDPKSPTRKVEAWDMKNTRADDAGF